MGAGRVATRGEGIASASAGRLECGRGMLSGDPRWISAGAVGAAGTWRIECTWIASVSLIRARRVPCFRESSSRTSTGRRPSAGRDRIARTSERPVRPAPRTTTWTPHHSLRASFPRTSARTIEEQHAWASASSSKAEQD